MLIKVKEEDKVVTHTFDNLHRCFGQISHVKKTFKIKGNTSYKKEKNNLH